MPLSYRFNAEEMAYVIDNSDATTVVVDAEQAPLVAEVRGDIPKVRTVVVYGGAVPEGCTAWDDLLAGAARHRSRPGLADAVGGRRRDDLHVGHDREAEGRAAHDRPIASSCSRCSAS